MREAETQMSDVRGSSHRHLDLVVVLRLRIVLLRYISIEIGDWPVRSLHHIHLTTLIPPHPPIRTFTNITRHNLATTRHRRKDALSQIPTSSNGICTNVHFINISPTPLPLLPKPMRPLPKKRPNLSNPRHKHNLPTLAHPNSRLVRSLESMNILVKVIIRTLRNEILARLRSPACHAEGWRDGGDHATVAVGC
jgi:hypothetical protein